jgi:regulator of protease activity HflC (stomatin/prohibitin superfamily)
MWGIPVYNVWAAHKSGQADLARAQNEQMIQVAEAEGRVKAAEANKKAAIIEAEAVAKQVEVIGANLQKHDLYLKWQWIRMMEEREGETIYVPTEANLPILEAARLRNA